MLGRKNTEKREKTSIGSSDREGDIGEEKEKEKKMTRYNIGF